MGIIDDYFDGYYNEQMIESQVIVTSVRECFSLFHHVYANLSLSCENEKHLAR